MKKFGRASLLASRRKCLIQRNSAEPLPPDAFRTFHILGSSVRRDSIFLTVSQLRVFLSLLISCRDMSPLLAARKAQPNEGVKYEE